MTHARKLTKLADKLEKEATSLYSIEESLLYNSATNNVAASIHLIAKDLDAKVKQLREIAKLV